MFAQYVLKLCEQKSTGKFLLLDLNPPSLPFLSRVQFHGKAYFTVTREFLLVCMLLLKRTVWLIYTKINSWQCKLILLTLVNSHFPKCHPLQPSVNLSELSLNYFPFFSQILVQINELFRKLPSLCDITIPQGGKFTVCGDVHGQFYDLLNIFELNGLPSEDNPYVSFPKQVDLLVLC